MYHGINIDPILYSDQQQQPFFCSPLFPNDSNPTSKPPNSLAPTTPSFPPPPPLTFSPFFPSPFEDNNGIFHQSLAEAVIVDMEVTPRKGSTTTKQISIRKRSSNGKGDRHSKINTARGPRDRRMRLSLEVAKRFFGLQDMLGFDKASKTVEWLLNQAKEGIKQLARGKNHSASNSTSECEEVSGLDEVVVSAKNGDQKGDSAIRRKIKLSHRKGSFHVLARELRVKARERARERTKQKMRSRLLAADDVESKQSCSWNLLEKGEESNNQSQNVTTEAEKPSSQAIKQNLWTMDDEDMAGDDSLMTIKWSPSMIFNSMHNSGLLHEHQFAEFESLRKPWETYNNQSN